MAGKLFEYAILFHPRRAKAKPNADEDGESDRSSEILVEPKRIIAKDDKQVAILAAREIPDKYLDKLDQVEILIRPF